MNKLKDKSQYYIKRIDYLEKQMVWHEYALEVLGKLTEIHRAVDDDRDVFSILKDTRAYLEHLFDFELTAFLLVDDKSTEFSLVDDIPENEFRLVQAEVEQLIETQQFAWAINQNKACYCPAVSEGQIVLHVLKTRNRIRGMFFGLLRDSNQLDNNQSKVLTIMLSNCAYALESSDFYHVMLVQQHEAEKRVREKTRALEFEQSHDALTTLPRFGVFKDRIVQALSHNKRLNRSLAILLIDIDKFTLFNDLLGRQGGDKLIRQIADRLRFALREYDVVSRLGLEFGNISISRIEGDEFCVLLIDQDNIDGIREVVHRIAQIFSTSFHVNQKEVFLTVSMGVSVAPSDADDADSLLNNADIALYQTKLAGGNSYQFFSKQMTERSFEHLVIDNRLHKAIEEGAFELYYQPKICQKSGKITSVEALIRWPQEDGTIVGPDEFIPAAEQNGLIIAIGEWVLRKACEEIRDLAEKQQSIRIAINLSPRQLKDPGLLDSFKRIIGETKIDPGCLEVELTESALLHDVNNVIDLMDKLQAFGIRIALDDFGTGYSSFNYLKRLPINALKIDKSFIQDIDFSSDDEAIVSAIIVMAHALNISVVAEGVETKRQLTILKNRQCDFIQGYYYHRPMPAKKLHEVLEKYNGAI